MSASKEEINQTLRRLHSDFDFLLDNNVISSDLYDQLVEKIPRRTHPLSLDAPFSLPPLSHPYSTQSRSQSISSLLHDLVSLCIH